MARSIVHGHARRRRHSAEWECWRSMFSRCYNHNNPQYRDYGGRGIDVCVEWRGKGGFLVFFSDMGCKPSPKHTIDRINNDLGYSKENCRWATRSEQLRNTRRNRVLTLNGKSQCLTDWANDLGIERNVISQRIAVLGWDAEKAMTTPVAHRINRRMIEFNGQTHSISEWAKICGIKKSTIRRRIDIYGWSIEKALTTPA